MVMCVKLRYYFSFALCAWFLATGCATNPQQPVPWSAQLRGPVAWESFPGTRVDGACMAFAVAAVLELQRRGIEVYYVEYDWSTPDGAFGAHAICIFRNEYGGLSIADNMNPRPRALSKARNVLALIRQNALHATGVRGTPNINL